MSKDCDKCCRRERENRKAAACAILDALRLHGCPDALTAVALGVNPSTVCLWQAHVRSKRATVPSRSHVESMADLLNIHAAGAARAKVRAAEAFAAMTDTSSDDGDE